MAKCFLWIKKVSVLLMTVCLLSSCSADINDYKGTTPKFDLFEYFQGDIEAWGMVKDYTNKQTRRFHVNVRGEVDGDTLTLHEDFVYDDGETDTRVWTITRQGDGRYLGKAGDIIGDATGQVVGNALQWQYDFRLKTDEREIDVHFDDWMYRQDDRHLFNTTSITKWGVEVGEVTLFFTKQ
ncbi:DUF3833 domain-containing protein [Vibrio palustris]|uniref:Lipoprotein n=1 Tax=Vibrio palustris TaxID=1918946 RepID=A0A1R4B315_9VIBR|nr:DUF3833 domain-containing protein [Vibrio palustris]SJL83307.1 hypothetical protein VPAL9027_01273 [Vibrio palustris]